MCHTLKYLPFKRSAVIGSAIIFIHACPKNWFNTSVLNPLLRVCGQICFLLYFYCAFVFIITLFIFKYLHYYTAQFFLVSSSYFAVDGLLFNHIHIIYQLFLLLVIETHFCKFCWVRCQFIWFALPCATLKCDDYYLLCYSNINLTCTNV